MTESMGRLPDEVVGHSILEFIAPEYHAKVAESIRLRLDHGLNESYEIELQPREGKRRIVNIRGTVISFEGSPAIMNVLTDITAVKQTEKALLESEEKYRSLVENSNDIIYSMDTTGVIRNISPQISRYGFSEDEVLSRSLTSFIEEEDLPGVLRDFETTLTTGRSTITIFRIRDKSGMIRWMEDNGTAIFDLSGGVVGLSGILRDITDRKHAEDSLHESEERFRSLVETSPDIVWEIDPRGLFVYISPMVSTILGYMPEEILGRSITELVPERAKPFVMQGLAEHIMSDSPLPPLQVPARHRDGHELTLEIRSSKVMDAEGNLTGLRGLAVDITDRKKTEDAIRLANHQINLITSITRHDIKNKIAVILGYLGIAKEASTDPTHGDYIAKIESATLAIQSLIEEAKVYQELGSQEPRWQDLESTLPLAYVPGSVTLNSSVGGIEVYADLMLGKVFFNLLDNSLQHGEHATEITVSSRRTGEALLLLWEDNGVGIPEGEKEKIFERGYGKHTGLGMFLVREILALTGITIRETGIPGRGARFEIKVPEEQFRISP
jgi:PAS domain S-box-containing protein